MSKKRELTIENSWTRDTLQKNTFAFRRMNRMSPLVIDNVLVEANAVDGILAFNRKTGSQLWRLNLKNGVEGGVASAGDKLFFGSSDGDFYCVSLNDGKVIWTFPVRAETLAAPTFENGVVYFQSGSDVVYALDAASGKQLWTYNRQTGGTLLIRATTRPVVAGDSVLVGFSDGFVVSLKKHDGSLQWEKKIGKAARFRDVDSTPVIDGKNMYVASFDAALYSLDVDTGNINWSTEEGGYVPVTVGTGALADRLYYSTAGGKILIVDKNSGIILHSVAVKNGIATQPVVAKGYMIYGESEGAFIVASADNGAPLMHFVSGDGLVAKPTVLEQTGEAYFISNAATIYALKLGYRHPSDLLPWQVKPGIY